MNSLLSYRTMPSPDSDFFWEWSPVGALEVLEEDAFRRFIAYERKRSERSNQPFLLMLVDAGSGQPTESNTEALQTLAKAWAEQGRETDIVGWYRNKMVVGVLFTGVEAAECDVLISSVMARSKKMLHKRMPLNRVSRFGFSFHSYPEDWGQLESRRVNDQVLYPDLFVVGRQRRPALIAKRLMDIVISSMILLLCLPLFLAIALAIKISSRGPVFFKQNRVGQYGRCFSFLKFRSMYVNNNAEVHKKFVMEMIQNGVGERKEHPSYKIKNDVRVTRIGKFLRKSSLDELPQLINVLKGEMSLVGPRPAIPYEVEAYRPWHRRRVLEARPGLTGLWQVEGRSRVSFDEMVRMDLRYAKNWSLWLDLKILLRTPLAVLRCSGAC